MNAMTYLFKSLAATGALRFRPAKHMAFIDRHRKLAGGILLGDGDHIVFTPGFRVPMDWLRSWT